MLLEGIPSSPSHAVTFITHDPLLWPFSKLLGLRIPKSTPLPWLRNSNKPLNPKPAFSGGLHNRRTSYATDRASRVNNRTVGRTGRLHDKAVDANRIQDKRMVILNV